MQIVPQVGQISTSILRFKFESDFLEILIWISRDFNSNMGLS